MVRFVVFPLTGALLLALLSIFSKMAIGADLSRLSGYMPPALYGVLIGFIGGGWHYRLKRAIEEQSCLRQQYYDLFENASDLIQSVTLDGQVLFVNSAWKRTLGYSDEDLFSLNIFDIIVPEDQPHCRRRIKSLVDGEDTASAEVTFMAKDGRRVLLEGNVSISYLNDEPDSLRGIFRDVTQRRQAEEKIHQLAYYDALTSLPNRAMLHDRLEHALAEARRFHHHLAVMFMDLDDFKKINDNLGHDVGDQLLVAAAQRLKDSVRGNDTAARLGGDEFVAVLSRFNSVKNLPAIANKMLGELSRSYHIDGRDLVVSASIGVAVYPQDGENSAELMRNADIAMYAAKNQPGNSFQFFSASMNDAVSEQLELENGLRRAFKNGELSVCYQPQVDWKNKQLLGFEALLRWHHPQRGDIAPQRFVPVAEDCGLILPIGAWVLRQSCCHMAELQRQVAQPLNLSINLSGKQIEHGELVSDIQTALGDGGLQPEQLELDITETILMNISTHGRQVLEEITAMGVRLAIDDFGTGYSSLNYLMRYHIDRLKIDRSFLIDLLDSGESAAIVETMIAMSRNMGMDIIAEGVETEEQADYLYRRNCQQMQGFLIAEALSVNAISELLEHNKDEDCMFAI